MRRSTDAGFDIHGIPSIADQRTFEAADVAEVGKFRAVAVARYMPRPGRSSNQTWLSRTVMKIRISRVL